MAPQTSIPVVANVLGTIGTVLWSIQLIPQIWYNWKRKKTDGLPGLMMFIWAICAVPFGIYAVVQNFNIPLQVQPQVFLVLSLVSWSQILIYNSRWRTWTASLLAFGIAAAFGGVQALLILTLRGPYARDWIFIGIDWLGAFISLMALVAQNIFDYLGGVLYIVLLLESGIVASHIIWRIRTRKLHKRAKAESIDFDDLEEAKRYQVPADRAIATSGDDSSQDLEFGNRGSGDGHNRSAPARRRSSVSGAVGYVLPPAVPIEPKLKKSWRPASKRLESGKPLVSEDSTLIPEN